MTDKEILELVCNTWRSVKVTDRGGIMIDEMEVFNSPESIRARARAKSIVEGWGGD